MANLIPVIRRDGRLRNAIAVLDELQDDLRVEMPIGRQRLQRQLRQGSYRIRPVPAVKLAQLRPDQPVFHARENLIADILVHRHVPLSCRPGNHHP